MGLKELKDAVDIAIYKAIQLSGALDSKKTEVVSDSLEKDLQIVCEILEKVKEEYGSV